jgi:hypothetical protein
MPEQDDGKEPARGSMVAHDDLRCSGRREQAMARGIHAHRRRASQGRQPGSDFRLTRGDISLADFEGTVEIFNIVLSLDTGLGRPGAR